MQIIQVFGVAFMTLFQSLCFGQADVSKSEPGNLVSSPGKQIPLYVVKVDNKSLEFDARKKQNLDLNSIDPNSINSVSVLKGEDAIEKYGEKGTNGVVIITIKNFDLLSKELQTMINAIEKN